jgi:hypothetical protein
MKSDADLADYITDLADAGQSCRDALRAVVTIINPKE